MTDTSLQRASRMLDEAMVEPLRRKLIGRKLVAENKSKRGTGKYAIDIDTITETSPAHITYALDEIGKSSDMIEVTTARKQIPIPHKSFKVPRQSYLAFKSEGKAIDTAAAVSAAYVVGQKEDAMIINGWAPDGTNYEVEGFFEAAGTAATGATWATAGNCIKSVQTGIAALEDLGVSGPYHLLLHKDQAKELRGNVITGSGREIKQVLEMMNNDDPNMHEGKVWQCYDMTADYAILIPVDPARVYFELVNPVLIHTELGVDSKKPESSAIYGHVWEVMVPIIKQTTAICKIDTI
jgi:uncharacterized linocin/CFP29 family protein